MNDTDQIDAGVELGCILLLVLTQGRLTIELNDLKISQARPITDPAEVLRV